MKLTYAIAFEDFKTLQPPSHAAEVTLDSKVCSSLAG